ncbi:MAG: hypothetical protein KY455_10415 [Euryarchaeota archaeon]|nr:hypothetical protein [Euryarchaeota archaeon]
MNPQLIGLGIDTGGALVMMALAVWVWRVRPQNRLNRAFAALVSMLGVAILLLNLGWAFVLFGFDGETRDLFGAAGGVGLVIAAALVILLERRIPLPRSFHPGRALRWWPVGLALLYASITILLLVHFSAQEPADADLSARALVNPIGVNFFTLTILYLLGRLAVRYTQSQPDEEALRWQCATIALALGSFPLFSTAAIAISPPIRDAVFEPINALLLTPLVLAALTWTAAGTGSNGRIATVTGLILLILILAGFTASALYDPVTALNSGAIGAMRVAGSALLAYSIVRHQLFEIDLKVKWTISRGTVAGTVLMTFLVVSQLVENIASDAFGLLAGSFAAGILLFLIQPLLRFADRVADRAMPNVQDTEEYRTVRKRDVYLAALEGALVDGVVSERERDMLARLQDQLGLTATEARELERALGGPVRM